MYKIIATILLLTNIVYTADFVHKAYLSTSIPNSLEFFYFNDSNFVTFAQKLIVPENVIGKNPRCSFTEAKYPYKFKSDTIEIRDTLSGPHWHLLFRNSDSGQYLLFSEFNNQPFSITSFEKYDSSLTCGKLKSPIEHNIAALLSLRYFSNGMFGFEAPFRYPPKDNNKIAYELGFFNSNFIFDPYNNNNLNFSTNFVYSMVLFAAMFEQVGPDDLKNSVFIGILPVLYNGKIIYKVHPNFHLYFGNQFNYFLLRQNKWVNQIIQIGLEPYLGEKLFRVPAFISLDYLKNRTKFKIGVGFEFSFY